MKCLRTAGDRICQDHFDPDDIVERTSCTVYRDKKHYFENPFNKDQKVYIFPDVLHCLKNLRNVMDQ